MIIGVCMRVTVFSGLLLLGMLPDPRQTPGGESKPLPVEVAVQMAHFGPSLRGVSPDGEWMVYAARMRPRAILRGDGDDAFLATGVSDDALGSDILIVSLKTRETKNLTEGKGSNWMPSWSPNGRYLSFLSDRDDSGQARLWVWDREVGDLRKVSEVNMRMPGPQQIQWTPDSQQVLVTIASEERGTSIAGAVRGLAPGSRELASGYEGAPSAIVYRSFGIFSEDDGTKTSDPLSTSSMAHDLALVEVMGGKTTHLVRNKKIATYQLSKDGRKVAYSTPTRFEKAGSQQLLFNVSVLELSTGSDRVLIPDVRLDLIGSFSISPDGKQLCFRASGAAETGFDVYVVNIGGGEVRNLTRFAAQASDEQTAKKYRWYFSSLLLWDHEAQNIYFLVNGVLWRASPRENTASEFARIDGRRIRQLIAQPGAVISVTHGGRSTIVIARDDFEKRDGFYKIDLMSGQVTRLLERKECYTCDAGPRGYLAAVTTNARSIVYTSQDAQHASDLWMSDVDFLKPIRLTGMNPELEKYAMGVGQLIDWLDDDGERLHGALLLPSNYQEGNRYPLIVLQYGGETVSEALRRFGGFEAGMDYLNVQLLTTRGYAVLMPDAPQHLGTPMLDLAKTVLPGVNKVVEMGIADPNRLGLMGHSYGGYSTLALLVQTKRFKAAMEADGTGNLVSAYGELKKDGTAFGTSSETGQQLVGGSPWQHRDRYIENSPVFYLDRMETPLLIIHGSEDTTVAPFLGDEVFVNLRRLGKIVEYARYDGEGHIAMNYWNQVDIANRMIIWFDKYLKSN